MLIVIGPSVTPLAEWDSLAPHQRQGAVNIHLEPCAMFQFVFHTLIGEKPA